MVNIKDKTVTNTLLTYISTHWAKDDIHFIVNQKLLTGIISTNFNPNTSITKGMFITALGRLANVDVSIYNQSSFTHVKSDTYYMGYIEWTNKNNIINDTSNREFAADQPITREQIAIIMQNYTRVLSFVLPKVYDENIFEYSIKISTYAKDAVKQM